MTKSLRTCLGVGVLVLPVWLLGAGGCSDSAGAPGADASTADVVEAGPPPPLGVPVSSCSGCPVCGGVLTGPDAGVGYCTQNCATNSDCPTGTACALAVLSTGLAGQCLRSCTGDTDCQGGFICRSDLASPGQFCWSAFPPPAVDAGQDAALDASSDANAGDTGAADTGAPDAGSDASPDGEAPDAATADAGDAAPGDQ